MRHAAASKREWNLAERLPAFWVALNTARLGLSLPTRFSGTICRGPSGVRALALTFDDGPDPRTTPAILDALAHRDVRATFFFSGAAIERHPDLARRAAERHEIGTHLFSHDRRKSRSVAAFDAEVRRCLDVHDRVLGIRPAALRFPFGDAGRVRRADVRRWGLTAYRWTFSSLDSSARGAADVIAHVVPRLHPGAIVLFHDGRGAGSTKGTGSRRPTVEAMPQILDAALSRGFQLFTLREMFNSRPRGGG